MYDNKLIGKSLLMLLLLALIIGGVAYILFPTTFESKKPGRKNNSIVYSIPPHVSVAADLTNTQEWKTYSNAVYKYRLSYPPQLDIVATDAMQDLVANQSNGPNGSVLAIKVHISVNQPVYDYKQMNIAAENTIVKRAGYNTIIKVKNTKIEGYDAVAYRYETVLPDSTIQKITTYGTLIKKNSNVIDISSWGDDSSIYNAVIPTLKLK